MCVAQYKSADSECKSVHLERSKKADQPAASALGRNPNRRQPWDWGVTPGHQEGKEETEFGLISPPQSAAVTKEEKVSNGLYLSRNEHPSST